jgi:hypothetical protein
MNSDRLVENKNISQLKAAVRVCFDVFKAKESLSCETESHDPIDESNISLKNPASK